MQNLRIIIEDAFENKNNLTIEIIEEVKHAVDQTINLLDNGILRVAEKKEGKWITNQWIKKAILLFFQITNNSLIYGAETNYFDKINMKFFNWDDLSFQQKGIRVVPPASVRKGAHIKQNTIIMPSYINIGAFVDKGTMIDTWATVGSCAQIGKNVHISGGVGIGGVLEPLQSNPTIIEDNCFIGARSEIVEGVIIEEGSVISMGVYIGQSTKIYNRKSGEISYGRIPAGSVVVSGSLPSKDHEYNLYCAIIVKKVDKNTRAKVSVNEILRTI
ncbi:2,3,4,5-tetrahydropyridine-2,6-dicarboxylate N-succinyltransferase [Candidatus Pantoea edessiphila]|uniref:2,3,4,5-tetrahydropyridine-2,6-dicarboxylate N-succinyltransferase n=1 Tax=Candidatus Pantoea edessiphila TaxID=2044610 RepID=A0A2P5SY19_9GAMM|nr:2,3,4,5-tetrahydropyridine-2,6-dicarboxylate N-succinyltransferase [Candidatus Pantoea edessiphila]MBK4775571.1 2,3,4,5-tetrahydropyridine-2,6-dicarboxylate N-succinyltransferase [Pantoea sp. Edef]PPI87224.1 2,3,4,5-tetrahydropyridine-2,6-dicarboxylate N-succinyltransferase [Candidatus Pantoea edessiphila]